jgi:deoxyadenosine/deoxycytidine kinase
MTELKITVSGPVKSGKSTVTRLIKESLDRFGIPVLIENEDSKVADVQTHTEKLYSARNSLIVKIYQENI